MSTTVKHFHSAMSGAPVLNGVAGSTIGVLDACLVNGFGLSSVDSLVVSGGVATLNIAAGHSLQADVIALVAGANVGTLNGEHRILSTTTTTATFDATSVPDQTATGAINVKIAPAGWQKVYGSGSTAVYRSSDVTGTRMYLRVDDSSTSTARVTGYEAMSDMNTGVRPFPTAAQVSGGLFWPKAHSATPTARAWTLVADSRSVLFHLQTNPSPLGASGSLYGFGDIASDKSGDNYACALFGPTTDYALSTSAVAGTLEYVTPTFATLSGYAARSFTTLGGSAPLGSIAESLWVNTGVSGTGGGVSNGYPNGANNALLLARKLVGENNISTRGAVRGLLVATQNCHSAFAWRDIVDGQGAYAGRKLLAVKCGAPAGVTSQGVVFIDITGPWG